MKIRKTTIYYNLISFIIIFLSIFYKNKFNLVTWMLILETVLTIIVIRKEKSLLSVGSIFILFTLLFHCGQAIITTIGMDDPYIHRSVISKAIDDEFVNAEIYVLLSILFLGNGYLFYQHIGRNKKKNEEMDSNEEKSLKYIKNIALIILLFSFIPMIYIDLLKIIALKDSGYMQTYEVYKSGIQKYIALIAKFARPAISILLLSYKNKPKKCKTILISSTIYYVLMMLSGDRGTYIIYILCNLIIYYRCAKKIKIKTIILYSIIGYFFLGFISAISMFRYSEWSLDSLINIFNLRSSNGILYSCLREFGVTMETLIYAMRFVPSYSHYNYGLTYLIGLLNISPILPNTFVENYANCFAYIYAYPLEYQNSLGGSFLGELYYNFGWLGVVATFLIGILIGKVDYNLDKYIDEKNWIKVAVIVSFIPNIILWVRDYFSGILFIGFWMWIMIKIFNTNKRKDKMLLLKE